MWLSADPKDGGVTGLVAKPLQGSDLAEAALEAATWLWSALSGVQYTGDDDAAGESRQSLLRSGIACELRRRMRQGQRRTLGCGAR